MAIDKAQATGGPVAVPRRFTLPPMIESNEVDPERMVPFDDLVGRGHIVVVGTLGKVFNAGLGEAVRVLWLPADEYETLGPDRDQCNVSLVPASSIPARVALECQEAGQGVTCRVLKQVSKRRPGQSYYLLVP